MKRSILLLIYGAIPVAVFAQVAEETVIIADPSFFTALIAGIIIAFGFQLLLTNLSAAAGLSALSIGKDKEDRSSGKDSGGSSTKLQKNLRKVNSAFGVFALVTTSISLFFAAWLAVELSTALTVVSGIVIGLAIWGLFYIATAVLEMSAITSTVGSLVQLVRSGFQTVTDAAGNILSRSDERRTADIAKEVTETVRDEVFGDVHVRKTIQNYIDQMKPDYRQIRREIETILSETEVESDHLHVSPRHEEVTSSVQVKSGPSASDAKNKGQSAARKVKDTAQKVREETSSDKSNVEKAADAGMRVAGLSHEQAEQQRKQVEQYLAKTGKAELNPDGIKRDLERIVTGDRDGGVEAIRERLRHVDRSTVTAILAQREDMSEDEARRVVDRVSSVVNNLTSRYEDARESAEGSVEGYRDEVEQRRGAAEAKLRDYLDSLDNPNLEYDVLKADFETLLHDPRAGADSLINRLKTIDRDDLKQMIAHSRPNLSEQDVEHAITRFEEARDKMIARAEQMRDKVAEKLEQAKAEALHQAEETRKVAASAAWWIFLSALVSGIAAAAGGYVGIVS